jgi:hypothetical protein
MPRNADEITRSIEQAIRPGFRGRLLARGLARNLIWSKGNIPEGGQRFEELLTSNLLSYGVGLFQLGLELRTLERDNVTAINAFGRAGEAIESVIRDGDPEFIERGFYTVLAAAAYHLGHFSARAFSLFPSDIQALNLSPAERSLTLLMRRDLAGLRATLLEFSGPGGFDETLANKLGRIDDESAVEEAIYLTLESLYHKALAIFDFALESGNVDAVRAALELLNEGVAASAESGSVSFWWIFTITRHLLEDLWDQSLHVRLPIVPNDGPESQWNDLRQLFIAKLLKQNRAEIELWPSQVGAAARAIDMSDDLVAALPTSAGKTRIAEICILRALALGKRIVFVTPLRALSAQTERSLRQTVSPLGFSVSSLYGSSGATGDDVDSLRNRNVVVTTPEKLDFAMRNDPSLLDDVGLIVLDESHFAFSQSQRIYSRPELIDWIDTAIANRKVPIALVSTPQFMVCMTRAASQVDWNFRQFRRRVRRYVKLPAKNTPRDIEAVIRRVLPGAPNSAVKQVLSYVHLTRRDLSAVGDVVDEIKAMQGRNELAKVTYEEVIQVIDEHLVPSEKNFIEAITEAESKASPGRTKRGRPVAATSAESDGEEFGSEPASEGLSANENERGLRGNVHSAAPLRFDDTLTTV